MFRWPRQDRAEINTVFSHSSHNPTTLLPTYYRTDPTLLTQSCHHIHHAITSLFTHSCHSVAILKTMMRHGLRRILDQKHNPIRRKEATDVNSKKPAIPGRTLPTSAEKCCPGCCYSSLNPESCPEPRVSTILVRLELDRVDGDLE